MKRKQRWRWRLFLTEGLTRNKVHTADNTKNELTIKGIGAAPGIAIGPAYVYSKHVPKVEEKSISRKEIEGEIERLRAANTRSEKELQKIHSFAEQKLGSQNAKIFEAQIMILNDSILMSTIEKRIKGERKNAESVVFDEISKYKRLMLAARDEYMHERAHDVEDVMNRIIRNIQDQRLFSRLEGEAIIITEALAPADAVIFSRNRILGYATDLGGITSHAALLSRSLKIPAAVGLRKATASIQSGDFVALDGYAGTITIHPSEETITSLQSKAKRFAEFEQQLATIAKLPAVTKDNRTVELSSNVEFLEGVEFSLLQGSAGVGLYRTESQVLGRDQYPSEEEQFKEYEQAAEKVFPHSVIFRTFDIGGDKLAPEFYHEENPFLGWRGIRVCLDRPEMFLTQLRALLRASTRKNVRIMFPMVSTVQEVRLAKDFVNRAKEELRSRHCAFDANLKIGVMIEVPSAAMLAADIAREVDFLSIGTNDLIQYLLAVDRDNSAVAPLYQQFHPAVLRTIKMVIDAGHSKDTWVGMCGEMAGDPLATILLLGLGIDELSVVPTVLPEIKKIIRSVSHEQAKEVSQFVLTLSTELEIKEYLYATMAKVLPEIPLEI